MRKLIFSVLAALIISTGVQKLPTCNLTTVKLAFAPQIFAQTTIDGREQNVLVTRFFHNKLGIYGQELSKCYFNALDLNFLTANLSLIGLLTFLTMIYKSALFNYWYLLLMILAIPVLPILGWPLLLLIAADKIFAIMGLVFLLKKK